MGKKPTETFKIIEDDCTLTLSDSSTKRYELFRFDMGDNLNNDNFAMDLDRETLKGLADFIYKYLENK